PRLHFRLRGGQICGESRASGPSRNNCPNAAIDSHTIWISRKISGKERKSPMKNIAVALALVLAGSSLAVGLASTDANAGSAKKICKQEVMMHPMAGTHRALMKQCKAQYKAYKKAGHAPAT